MDAGDDNLASAIAISPVSVAMIFEGDAFHYKSGKTEFKIKLENSKCPPVARNE